MLTGKLVKTVKLLHHSIYTEYRKYGKIKKDERVEGREELRSLIGTICKHISEGMTESKGGVNVDNMGYFFMWKVPRKMPFLTFIDGEGLKEKYNFHTDQYIYLPTYYPSTLKNSVLMGWTMDKTFKGSIKEKLCGNLRSGLKYNNYLHTLNNI